MTKWLKPGVYTQEIDLSYVVFRNGLEGFINSFVPKLFYEIQYDEPSEKIYILVPEVLVDEIRERIRREKVGDFTDIGKIVIEVESSENHRNWTSKNYKFLEGEEK